MHGVSCVDVCVNGRGSACTVLFTHACAPVGLHTAHTYINIHTYTGCTYYVLCGCVCTRCTGGVTCTVFFRVCTAHVLSHVYVHGLPSPTEGQLGLVGMHDRAREVHTPT